MGSLFNPLSYIGPPNPESVSKYVDSVQSRAPTVAGQIGHTVRQACRAVLTTGATVATAPLWVPEATLHFAGNVLSAPSVLLHKAGSITNKTRTKVYNTLAGSPDESMAA